MKNLSAFSIVIGLIIVLTLSITLMLKDSQTHLSGQVAAFVSEKIGLVQAEETDIQKPQVPTVISLPIPPRESPPSSFEPPETKISTHTPEWGEGTPIVTGESVVFLEKE